MRGEKLHLYLKKKLFLSAGIPAGKLVEYGGGEGTGINYGNKM